MPEIERVEQVLLTGEPPDLTQIPTGCRFHPRCPAVNDGTAEAAGILDRVPHPSLPILAADTGHAAACFLTDLRTPPTRPRD